MRNNREIVCIVCPNGCRLNVMIDENNKVTKVENALCRNGQSYAVSEVQCPMRSLTTSARIKGGNLPLVSVRSDKPIPKEKIQEAISMISKLELEAPVGFHQVLIHDILGTGVDIISTKEIRKGNQLIIGGQYSICPNKR